MADDIRRCTVCGALIDEEDLFCANCGTEAPHDADTDDRPAATVSTHNFDCQGCGASMSYDASAQTLRCPFCGSERLDKQTDTKVLAPQRIIPFNVARDRAVGILRGWLGNGFWRPSDLADAAAVTKMSPVYVPYWVFEATTYTYWTADTNQTPRGARGDWYPMSGDQRGRYTGLLVGASGVLTPQETHALCPFELGEAVPTEDYDLTNWIVEQFRVQRKYARPQAREGLEALEMEACKQYVPGRCRNLKVNVRMEGLSSEPVLLPVWIMAYRYKDEVFRFLINGQTGRAHGQAPISYTKIIAAIAIVIGVVLLIILGAAAVMAVSMRPDANQFHATDVAADRPIFTDELWLAKPSCNPRLQRTKKRTAICARNAWQTWSASARFTSGCKSWSMPRENAANRWAISCSTDRPAWARPRSPCAFRASLG